MEVRVNGDKCTSNGPKKATTGDETAVLSVLQVYLNDETYHRALECLGLAVACDERLEPRRDHEIGRLLCGLAGHNLRNEVVDGLELFVGCIESENK